jgi:glycerol-3-phosphate acyltransferase PlsY
MTYLYLLFSYLLGSVPTGYLLYKLRTKEDIRGQGSQNIGATNVLRVRGWRLALPVALGDILKGAIPVFLGLRIFEDPRIALLGGLLTVLGHCYPIYIRFKGGKGVATAVGVYSVLAYKPLLGALAIFVLVIIFTRKISLGSLSAALTYPLLAWILERDLNLVLLGLFMFMLITFRHRGNIQRLISGTEKKLGGKTP